MYSMLLPYALVRQFCFFNSCIDWLVCVHCGLYLCILSVLTHIIRFVLLVLIGKLNKEAMQFIGVAQMCSGSH